MMSSMSLSWVFSNVGNPRAFDPRKTQFKPFVCEAVR
jgi:hypothetical protein